MQLRKLRHKEVNMNLKQLALKVILILLYMATHFSVNSQEYSSYENKMSLKNIPRVSSTVYKTDDLVVDSVVIYNSFNEKSKYSYRFDSHKNLIQELYRNWDGEDWENSMRLIYNYDSTNNLSSVTQENWDENKWTNVKRDEHAYDTNNNLLFLLEKYWNGNEWDNSRRYTYSYDTNNKLTMMVETYWFGGEEKNHLRLIYTYDPAGKLEEILREKFNNETWAKFSRFLYNYDPNNNLSQEKAQAWMNNEWINAFRSTYSYDSENNLQMEIIEEFWSDWENSSRHQYTYDANGKLSGKLEESWFSDRWESEWRYKYNYDTEGKLIFLTIEEHIGSWRAGDNFFDYIGYHKYHGSEFRFHYGKLTDIADETGDIFNYSLSQNYPNPFNPTTTIEFTLPKSGNVELSVYNLLGEEITTLIDGYKTQGNHSINFDGHNLSSGIYFYRITTNKMIITKKMLLMK